jgi:hypothetical protein
MTVQVQGADNLARTLADAADAFADLGDANTAAGRHLAIRAAAAAPRRTGRLAASVRPVPDRTGVTVGSSLIYAPPIHWGWPARNIAPQPFLADTLTTQQPAVVEVYATEVERVLGIIQGI